MPYDPRAVANHLLGLAAAEGDALTPMKMQKLVFFAHGWSLAVLDEPLISEQVEAWDYGPVIPKLYHTFKEYGSGPIDSPAIVRESSEGEGDTPGTWSTPSLDDDPGAKPDAERLIHKVWNVYKKYTGVQLSNWTHIAGSPWRVIYEKNEGNVPRGTIIPDPLIKEYFIEMASPQVSVR